MEISVRNERETRIICEKMKNITGIHSQLVQRVVVLLKISYVPDYPHITFPIT